MNQHEGLSVARAFRRALERNGYPVRRVIVFGSVARDDTHADSDIDIAVVCDPFRSTRHEENMELRRERREIDVRIEPICLHTTEVDHESFGLVREIERTGVDVCLGIFAVDCSELLQSRCIRCAVLKIGGERRATQLPEDA